MRTSAIVATLAALLIPAAAARAAAPRDLILSLHCLSTNATNVECRLTGRGYWALETLRINYVVTVIDADGYPLTVVYRRSGSTNINGYFARPLFSFNQSQVDPGFIVRVTVGGNRGERASAEVQEAGGL